MQVLSVFSHLLDYPTAELVEAKDELISTLKQSSLTEQNQRAVCDFITTQCEKDILDWQAEYDGLFERGRALGLWLFEHVHGESRDRGGAMVSLIETYREAGFDPATSELPDHLPVLLEFLSTRPSSEVRETLSDAAHIFEALQARLERRESPYAAVFAALIQIAGAKANKEVVEAMLAQPDDDPTDLKALDEVWEESEVTFGPDPNAGCPQVRDMLAQMDTPINPAPQAAAK